MIFIYEKGTNKFMGIVPSIVDNGKVREARLDEIYSKKEAEQMATLVVKDSPKFAMDPTRWEWELNEKNEPIGVQFRKGYSLRVTTNVQDNDGDGLFELMAHELNYPVGRPENMAEIRIQLMDGQKAAREAGINIKLTTTGGHLAQRLLMTDKNGMAVTMIRATSETRAIRVSIEGKDVYPESISFEVYSNDDYTTILDRARTQ